MRMSEVMHQAMERTARAEHVTGGSSSCEPTAGSGIYPLAKRSIDVAVALTGLLLTSPLILLGALAIKLSSRGPAFYRAKRAGLNGQAFAMFKLRTMRI